ncbi:MAG: DUF5615 family PIN-like protein [bacterium]
MSGGIRLLLDEHIHASAAPALRERGIDAIHVRDKESASSSDIDILATARSRRRVLVTRDAGDFMRLAEHLRASGGDPPGLLLVSHRFPPTAPDILVEALTEWVRSTEQMRLTVFRGSSWLRPPGDEESEPDEVRESRPSYARALERVNQDPRTA